MGKLQEYDALTGAEANDKNIYRVDKYVSGTEGISGVYETKRVTEGKLKEVLGIDAVEQQVQTNSADIVNLDGRVTQNETNIQGAVSGFQGTIAIADTPTEDGVYSPTEAGTYTNAGGLIYAPETTDKGLMVQFIKTGGSWTKNTIAFYDLVSKNVLFAENDIFKIYGFMRPAGTTSTSNTYVRSDYIDITGVTKIYIHTTPASLSTSPCVFFDDSFTYISGITPTSTVEQDFVITEIPSNAKYIVTSMHISGFSSFSFYVDKVVNPNLKHEVFISPTGDDYTGDGSSANPFKTYARAKLLLKEGGTVVFKEGDYTSLAFRHFYLSKNIKANSGERVRLLFGDRIESATLEGGYTRVYSTTYTSSIAAGYYLWQHDINDEATEILDLERHPLHNGKTYRLGSTRIYPASSISEIESTTDKLMWYKSGSTLYFSKAVGSDLSSNPIIIPSSEGVRMIKNIRMYNIDVLYTPIFTNQTNSIFKNVTVGFVNNSGALRFDDSIDCVFEKCEFYACSNDGANGHSAAPVHPFSNRTEAIFRDCWFHDNSDDGESCHQYSQTTHYGSLVEYNGNGITPASGGHSVCHNSTVRRNGSHPWSVGGEGSGFSAQGPPLDNGGSTDIWCYGCLSENNGIGFRAQNVGNTFINCISKDDTVAFAGTSNQINCVTI